MDNKSKIEELKEVNSLSFQMHITAFLSFFILFAPLIISLVKINEVIILYIFAVMVCLSCFIPQTKTQLKNRKYILSEKFFIIESIFLPITLFLTITVSILFGFNKNHTVSKILLIIRILLFIFNFFISILLMYSADKLYKKYNNKDNN